MTDSPSKAVLMHGRNGREFVYAVEAGMSSLEAIEAATANAAETLGQKMAPRSGQVRVGWDADLIAVIGHPMMDIALLAYAQNVSHVWRAGTLFKSPDSKTVRGQGSSSELDTTMSFIPW